MRRVSCLALLILLGCSRPAPRPLPTGVVLDPAGQSIALGSMPVSMIFSPDSTRIVAVRSGYREQGIQVIDRASRRVVQTLDQRAAFLGACFAPDGSRLFVSGGDRDVVYEYTWSADSAALADSIALGPPPDSTTERVPRRHRVLGRRRAALCRGESGGHAGGRGPRIAPRGSACSHRTLSIRRRGGWRWPCVRLGVGSVVGRHVRARPQGTRRRQAHRGRPPSVVDAAGWRAPAAVRDVCFE